MNEVIDELDCPIGKSLFHPCIWNTVLENIQNPNTLHIGTSRIISFWTPFCFAGALNVLRLAGSLAAEVRAERLTDVENALMSSASLAVMGQEKPTCNIGSNKVTDTTIEGNSLIIHICALQC